MLKVKRSEAIEECRTNLNYLMRICKPLEFKEDFPDMFIAVFNMIIENIDEPEYWKQYLIAMPRGLAKTTFQEGIACWFLTFSDLQSILLVCSTVGLAEEMLASVMDMLEEPDYVALFGSYRIELEKDTQGAKEFFFQGYKRRIEAKGAESKIRGKKRIARPQLYLLGDLQEREDSDSADKLDKLLVWLTTTLLMGRHNKKAIAVYCGNKYPTNNCLVSTLEKAPHWISVVMGALLSDGTALWEGLRSKASLLQELADLKEIGMEDSFVSEMLNGKVGGLFSGVDISKIPKEPNLGLPCIGRFIIIDVATDKETADQCVLMQFDLYPDDLCIIRRVVEGKWAHDDLCDKAIDLALETQTPLILYEDVSYQHILNKELTKSLAKRGILNMFIDKVSPEGIAKNGRIVNWFFKPLLKGTIYLSDSIRSLVINQVSSFNRMKTNNVDDILDTAAYHKQVIMDESLKYKSLLPVNDILLEKDEDMVDSGHLMF